MPRIDSGHVNNDNDKRRQVVMYLLSGMWIIWCGLVAIAGTAFIVLICFFDAWDWIVKLFKDLSGATEREEAEEKARRKAQEEENRRSEEERRVRNAALAKELKLKGGIERVIMTNRLKDTRAWEAAGRPADWKHYSDRRGRTFKPQADNNRQMAEEIEAQQKERGVWIPEIEDEEKYDAVCDWCRYAAGKCYLDARGNLRWNGLE